MNRYTRIIAIAVAVLVGACGDGPTNTEPSAQMSATVNSDLNRLATYTSTPPNLLLAFAARTIGPAGGSLRLYDFEIVVPAGAVTTPTRFSIKLPADPTLAERVFAEFQPHNQKFAVPVTIKLPYRGTSAEGDETVNVLWFDGASWVPFATSLTGDGRIQTMTNHFSEYGTEENGFSKGITLNGKPVR